MFYIKINNWMSNALYNNSIVKKLRIGKVDKLWWETHLRLKLIIGHYIYERNQQVSRADPRTANFAIISTNYVLP
jgi:hypothetical protein